MDGWIEGGRDGERGGGGRREYQGKERGRQGGMEGENDSEKDGGIKCRYRGYNPMVVIYLIAWRRAVVSLRLKLVMSSIDRSTACQILQC